MRFDIPLPPVAKARARVVKDPKTGKYRGKTPKKTSEYEGMVALHARAAIAQQGWQHKGNVEVRVIIRKDRATVCVEPSEVDRFGQSDLDNYVKAILDGLEKGGVYENDRKVVELQARFWKEGTHV